MRAIKNILIVLLVLLGAASAVTLILRGSPSQKVPPTISFPGEVLEVSYKAPRSALLEGVTASDEQDGDLTDRVVVGGVSNLLSDNTAKVTLLVFDSDDNMCSRTRYIRYTDYQRPRFDIVEPLIFTTDMRPSILDRITASDVRDGDISSSVRVSTLKQPEQDSPYYTVSIQVTNSLGDTAKLDLPVLVQEPDALRPVVILSDYLLYLKVGDSFDPATLLAQVKDPAGEADLSAVDVQSNVDTSKPGTYQVIYTYNSNDHVGTTVATVVVQ